MHLVTCTLLGREREKEYTNQMCVCLVGIMKFLEIMLALIPGVCAHNLAGDSTTEQGVLPFVTLLNSGGHKALGEVGSHM